MDETDFIFYLAISIMVILVGSVGYLVYSDTHDQQTVKNSHEYKTGYMKGYTEQNITMYNEYYNINSNIGWETSSNMEYIEGYEQGYKDRITENA